MNGRVFGGAHTVERIIIGAAAVLIGVGFLCAGSRAAEKPRVGPSVDFKHGDLKVAENKRFIVHADGTPFFYLGDTAWELFHRLSREEVD